MRSFVLVGHGSPSDPEPPDAALKRLAAEVQKLRPDCVIRAATLAKPDSLGEALAGLDQLQIYPFFMADGWFTRRELPRRLQQEGLSAPILPAFGLNPALPDLIAGIARDALDQNPASEMILIAHGSKRAHRSKDSAYSMAESLRDRVTLEAIHVALIEEPPFLADVAALHPHALCLPFFALRAGHVDKDIPEALAQAHFAGRLLAPVGEHPKVPELIAASLEAV